MNVFAFAWRRLRRGWRSGELLIVMLALIIAVAATGTVHLFSERVRLAIGEQSGDTLGADLVYRARDPLPASLQASIDALGLHGTATTLFSSVVFAGDNSALASVKAVGSGYPLRGAITLAAAPFEDGHAAHGVPAPGEAWADARLWQDLQLQPGAELQLGRLHLKLRGVITDEPGKGAGFDDLAPRLLINADDLAASGLLGVGSRAQYELGVSGARDALARLRAEPLADGVKLTTPQDARPELRNSTRSAGQFLDIAVLAATLLACAAVALSARQYGEKLRDEIALLKCLGARRGFLTRALLLQLLLLGLAAGAAGALLAYGAQELLARALGDLLKLDLPPPPLLPLLEAAGLGLLLLLGFAAPPMLAARNTPPLRVFQRSESGSTATRAITLIAMATAAALLWLATGDVRLAGWVLAGAGGALLALASCAWLLVRLLTPLRRAAGGGGFAWRFGLGNIARRRGATIAQVTALGLALLALLLVSVVREDLLSSWQKKLPPDTPNQFLINVQTEELDALKSFFAAHGYADLQLWPMARGRLIALNGKPVTADSFPDPETQRWINRDFNLSWSTTLNPDNRITQGRWWGEAGRGKPLLSADAYAIERLNLKLGDTMTLDFAGEQQTFTVSSFRTVDWDSFKPNFFLLAPPGAVSDLVPRQYLTSFYLPHEQRALLRQLVTQFPNVTVLDIDALMAQVRGIVDRIVRAVEFIFAFTLAAGLAVLLATIEGTRSERVRETALLRTLGAGTGLIARGLIAEYAVIGALAGGVAAIAAQTLAWVLAANVFHIAYGPRPLLWLIGTASGAVVVCGLGWLSLRSTLRTPPNTVLRQS
ncbi:ABC transporter permease [Solimonas terrae]|uniref:FtsX-like permease family protein n=1 Tax=Solimonas terrae TaxID=1396819 RepID=A0A6M2BWC9_9GAMM|nr:FtsX-like permease family protein [Solimonas terrae]NGY06575.1 FtsX-like permease family protein [Solimonas terrae]